MKFFTRFTGVMLILTVLTPGPLHATEESTVHYFFDREPFVPPKIIEDFSPWLSDRGEQVVAINLPESVDSNRYFAVTKTAGKTIPFVFYEKECDSPCTAGAPGFGYRLIGTTSTGTTVLFAESSGGGSGKFRSIILVSLESDKGISFDADRNDLTLDRKRLIIRKLAEIPLGDRYDGDITLKGDTLKISRDRYAQSAGLFSKDRIITFKPSR